MIEEPEAKSPPILTLPPLPALIVATPEVTKDPPVVVIVIAAQLVVKATVPEIFNAEALVAVIVPVVDTLELDVVTLKLPPLFTAPLKDTGPPLVVMVSLPPVKAPPPVGYPEAKVVAPRDTPAPEP